MAQVKGRLPRFRGLGVYASSLQTIRTRMGFRGLWFRGLGFRVLGFRVNRVLDSQMLADFYEMGQSEF